MKKAFILASLLTQIPAIAMIPQAHIAVPEGLPGIVGLLVYCPETAKPLTELAEQLLRKDSTLTRGERELIASYVSSLNECTFCCESHSAVAACELDDNKELVLAVRDDFTTADISEKMKALLAIAKKVQKKARSVNARDIAKARAEGATDREIHDAVLIAAAFCMYNRYVDGLGTWAPENQEVYDAMGKQISQFGYVRPRV
jgi:uncharacterized peroxidase-related enzyme